jgi:hypothetical protein
VVDWKAVYFALAGKGKRVGSARKRVWLLKRLQGVCLIMLAGAKNQFWLPAKQLDVLAMPLAYARKEAYHKQVKAEVF